MSIKTGGHPIMVPSQYTEEGLLYKEDVSNAGLFITGTDLTYIKADVRVKGIQLSLYSENDGDPVSVRNAGSITASSSLFNVDELLAKPIEIFLNAAARRRQTLPTLGRDWLIF
jgi:hypothetical protein